MSGGLILVPLGFVSNRFFAVVLLVWDKGVGKFIALFLGLVVLGSLNGVFGFNLNFV